MKHFVIRLDDGKKLHRAVKGGYYSVYVPNMPRNNGLKDVTVYIKGGYGFKKRACTGFETEKGSTSWFESTLINDKSAPSSNWLFNIFVTIAKEIRTLINITRLSPQEELSKEELDILIEEESKVLPDDDD